MDMETQIVERIETIQQELEEIKQLVSKKKSENINLLGVWEGADFSEEEIEEAKRSLFKGTEGYESE